MSEEQTPDVGARLRALRERRGLSMRALAERCELSPNTISLIERGATSPSVATLHHLASALRVPITAFFQEPSEKVQVIRSRPGERRVLAGSTGARMESLGAGLERQTLEPFLVTLQPGAESGACVVHAGHELVFCLQGEVEYTIEGQIYRLAAAESFLFEANLSHCWRNPSQTDPSLFLLIFQSSEVGQPLEHHLHP